MEIDNKFFMNLALREAWKYQGLTYPNPAVGCCVVGENQEILSIEAHKRSGEAHAEVLALKSAYFKLTDDIKILQIKSSKEIHSYLLKNHNNCFKNISVYATLEPCSHQGKTPSCANLLSLLGVKKVFIGARDENKIASCGKRILDNNNIKVSCDILKTEAVNLIYPFLKWTNERFVFFKWAQRLNASVDGGAISSSESRQNIHSMRDVCDLLIIGGNTVRTDRPTLDSRLVDGKAPDILIFSRTKDFDKNIPLFLIENREVFIEDNFEVIKRYKNIMIEGGGDMLRLSKDIVDLYLCYISSSFGGSSSFENLDDKFEIIYSAKNKKDIILWMKKEK